MSVNLNLRDAYEAYKRGRISKEMTHPFYCKDFAIMHNGIISSFGSDKVSDTCEFFNLLKKQNHSDRLKLINLATDPSKFLYFDGRKFEKFGTWQVDNGISYSNGTYIDYFENFGYKKPKSSKKDSFAGLDCFGYHAQSECEFCGCYAYLQDDHGFKICQECLEYEDIKLK